MLLRRLSHSLRGCGRPVLRFGNRPHSSTLLASPPTPVSHSISTSSSSIAMHASSSEQGTTSPPVHLTKIKSIYCRMCGSPMELVPLDAPLNRDWRHRCTNQGSCGYIDFHNPKIVVGAITEHDGKILLCRRAIEPCLGKWTIPAGFMELNESSAEGAARETMEEAGADVQIVAPYVHWDIPAIGQAYILFRAKLKSPYTITTETAESLEARLFDPADIPFDEIAFSSVTLALRYYLEDVAAKKWRVHHGVIDKKMGSAPNDPSTFQVRDLMSLETV